VARRGGIVGAVLGDDEVSRLVREFRRWAAKTPRENRWGLPPDQISLVSFAAMRIAPTILRRAGLPVDPAHGNTVAGYLLTVWANALMVLDRETIETLHAGKPPTDRVGSEAIVTPPKEDTDGDPDRS
jgi:hypothetical protein